jgi:hypothetical protein
MLQRLSMNAEIEQLGEPLVLEPRRLEGGPGAREARLCFLERRAVPRPISPTTTINSPRSMSKDKPFEGSM